MCCGCLVCGYEGCLVCGYGGVVNETLNIISEAGKWCIACNICCRCLMDCIAINNNNNKERNSLLVLSFSLK